METQTYLASLPVLLAFLCLTFKLFLNVYLTMNTVLNFILKNFNGAVIISLFMKIVNIYFSCVRFAT